MSNKLYQCPYNKAAKCDMKDCCFGCPDFRSHSEQSEESKEDTFTFYYKPRNLLQKLYYSRWGKYFIYVFSYTLLYKILGFEIVVISALAIIIGESHYINDKFEL